MSAAILSNCVAALRALAEVPGILRNTPCTRKPAKRCRKHCSTGCWHPHLQPGFHHGGIHCLRASISTSIRFPTRARSRQQFERDTLDAMQMPAKSSLRHRCRIPASVLRGGYASRYYSYMCRRCSTPTPSRPSRNRASIDAATAIRLRDFIYSAGNLRDPDRGLYGVPRPAAGGRCALKKRGLSDAVPDEPPHRRSRQASSVAPLRPPSRTAGANFWAEAATPSKP